MPKPTLIKRRGPILEQLYRRACIRIGVLQCVSCCFYSRNPHANGCFGFETSSLCIEPVLFGVTRGDSDKAFFSFFSSFCVFHFWHVWTVPLSFLFRVELIMYDLNCLASGKAAFTSAEKRGHVMHFVFVAAI